MCCFICILVGVYYIIKQFLTALESKIFTIMLYLKSLATAINSFELDPGYSPTNLHIYYFHMKCIKKMYSHIFTMSTRM